MYARCIYFYLAFYKDIQHQRHKFPIDANGMSAIYQPSPVDLWFSTKAFTLRFSFTAITPNSLASERGTSNTTYRVHFAPLLLRIHQHDV